MLLNNKKDCCYKHQLDFEQKCEISKYFQSLFNVDMLVQHKSDEIKSLINGGRMLLNVLGYDIVHIEYEVVEIVQFKDI